MALTALATIKGSTQKGRKTLKAGDTVPRDYFSKDELEHYKEIGVVGEPVTVSQAEQQADKERAELQARVKELEAKLAEAQAGTSSASGTSGPGQAGANSGSSGSSGSSSSTSGSGSSKSSDK